MGGLVGVIMAISIHGVPVLRSDAVGLCDSSVCKKFWHSDNSPSGAWI